MTKFERDELARLNRAMDQYRDALKKLVDALSATGATEVTVEALGAWLAAKELLA